MEKPQPTLQKRPTTSPKKTPLDPASKERPTLSTRVPPPGVPAMPLVACGMRPWRPPGKPPAEPLVKPARRTSTMAVGEEASPSAKGGHPLGRF
eukprot:CAMPEP_0174248394 /NCGR_PEP_ID=MMETSP0417-20130205/43055_1 /TAXON_ID=242541 /ORGANISM="Mayorella sp, Strain BSH-02190019" /LENGTH=93 /DNA_ID=CAMNT_0015328257 /DNA_START=526 /DNA_END=807 /DNA_ORIENTATION=-